MITKVHFKFQQLCTVTGAFLLLTPIGVQWFWGNLSVYVISSYYSEDKLTNPTISSWVPSLVLIFRPICYILGGFAAQLIGVRTTITLGIAIFNLGVFGAYFALQYNLVMMAFTLGALCGIGAGLLYGPSFLWVIQWSETTNVGFFVSVVQSSYPFGAILINMFTTYYLNPNNLVPDSIFQGYQLFSQKIIVQTVPGLFLIMGISFSVVQLLGLFLLNRPKNTEKDDDEDKKSASSGEERTGVKSENSTSHLFNGEQNVNVDSDYTPQQMLCTLPFYILSLVFILSDYTYFIIVNLYKAFGQRWIRDDHFLAFIGTTMVILNVPARLMTGLVVDRIGAKWTLIACFCFMAILCFFTEIAAMVDKWLYLAVITSNACATGGLLNVFMVASVTIYGKKHTVINSGLLNMTTIVTSLTVAPLIEQIVLNLGWHYLLFGAGLLNVLCQIITIVFLPRV